MKMKTTINRLHAAVISLVGVVAVSLSLAACTSDKTSDPAFVEIDGDTYVINYDKAGGITKFVMYSNIGHWQLLPRYEEDWEWITVFPKEGVDDARFSVLVQENKTAYPRSCELNIVNDNGEVMSHLTFNQNGAEPVMDLLYKKDSKLCSALGEQFKIKVSANIDWAVRISEDVDWLRSVEHTQEYELFEVDKNMLDEERDTYVEFYVDGTSITKSLNIAQAQYSQSFDTAEKISIADLRESLDETAGVVTANVYIQGYVVSDCTCGNFKGEQMYLMDESRAGILILFDDADSNDYPLNSLVTVHLFGLPASIDSETKALCFADMTRTYIMKSEETAGIAPIEISSVNEMPGYESCLVKLRNVEYVLPIGTYFNAVETSIGADYGDYNISTSVQFSEKNDEFVHPLRDADGNTTEIYTLGYSNFRAARLVGEGTGDITGVVSSREKWNGRIYNLRMRSLDDDTVSDDESTRRSKCVMQLGPWQNSTKGIEKVTACVGIGQLKESATGESVSPNSTAGNAAMYLAPCYVRNKAAELINGVWIPKYANTNDVMWYGICAQDWWQNNYNRILDCDGTAWIITASTAGYTGQLSFDIMQASSSSGPLYFTLEWSTNENAPIEEWTEIETHPVNNTSVSTGLKIFTFDLPAECCNRNDLVLRLRVPNAVRAKNTATPIDSGGTSRLVEIRISCR